jgi:glycosyltransferase involved in cell wall biosynthesis
MGVNSSPKKILYITYDGLTDPLGQSQILPYIKGLALHGYEFTILSFEKKDRFKKDRLLIESLTKESNINWVPLFFTSQPPLFSKFYDAMHMRSMAFRLHKKKDFDMVHCRSYVAADVGLLLKKKYGVKFFFDMRGFWADEKKDGTWSMRNPVFRNVYRYYKNKEAKYLQNADYIISLTEAGKQEMENWSAYNKSVPLKVIPCCADMNLFSLTSADQKIKGRQELGLTQDALVLSYLGSVGTWYMLDEMLLFFKQLKLKYPIAKFLFLTHINSSVIQLSVLQNGLNIEDFIIKEASRQQVTKWIKASDINIFFIKPVYSKISSSPTKLGEVLSMGIPVIANNRVGDVEKVIKDADAGYVLHDFTEKEFAKAIDSIPALLDKKPADIRSKAEVIYSLERGIELYLQCYRTVFNEIVTA